MDDSLKGGMYLLCWRADNAGESGRSIHGGGGALQDEEVRNWFLFL